MIEIKVPGVAQIGARRGVSVPAVEAASNIVAASIEADGWVLRLDVIAAPGTLLAYDLTPDATPKVVLSSQHAGFAPSGGEAVAATLNRTLVGTKPLRVAAEVVSGVLQAARIDETDLGGGMIRVRIALSEHIYATDTNLRLAVAAGWRTGEAAASGIVVTNNSTIVAPIPIMRWALPQLAVVNGTFRVSLLVVSHHPNGFQPVAGVKFTVTDGTTTKTAWTTALATDNSMSDNLRCYTLEIDPSTATALTAGLLRCDAEVYPWLGSMRPTDTAGTRSMATLRADARSVNAAAPYVVGYDPAGTRYGAMFAYLDPVSGTTTAAAGMVQTTLAGAKAVTAASRPKDINTALEAGYLFNRTLAAANGQAAITRSIDGMKLVLAPGTHADGAGAGAVSFGVNAVEIPIRIIGDPDDSNPRANCILQVATSRNVNRIQRVRLERLTWEIGGATMFTSTQETLQADDCLVRGRSGLETDTTAPVSGTVPTAGTFNWQITRTRWWRTASNISAGNQRCNLLRNCEHSRFVSVFQCAVKNRFIPWTEDTSLAAIQTSAAYQGWLLPTLPGQAEDLILAHNDMRSIGSSVLRVSKLPAATAGTRNESVRRFAMFNNLFERIGAWPEAFYAIGENELMTMSYNIIEGNTFAGERSNTFYSDPPVRSLLLRGDTGVSANAIVSTAHGFANGNQVRYYTTLSAPTITGLTNGTTYFVVNTAANNFQLAATLGGAPLSITAIVSTIVGQNFANLSDVNDTLNDAFVNRVAGNIFDWLPTKHDDFQDAATSAARGDGNAWRPQMIAAWSMLYGVCHEGNVDCSRRVGAPSFPLEYSGARSVTGYTGALSPGYTSDRSVLGTDAGGGDYTLTGASPALGRVIRGQCDRDFAGTARSAPADAGVLERV
jgi:hypothetical protein